MLRKGFGVGIVIMLAAGVPAHSQTDAVSYTYDALGRLVQTSHSGTANSSVHSSYQYDAAGNRINVTVSGASAVNAGSAFPSGQQSQNARALAERN